MVSGVAQITNVCSSRQQPLGKFPYNGHQMFHPKRLLKYWTYWIAEKEAAKKAEGKPRFQFYKTGAFLVRWLSKK